MGRLENKVAIVTGGARGNGRAIAERFAAEGARVAVCDVIAPELPFPGDAMVFRHADVANGANVHSLIDATLDAFGGLDVLVNNAGIEIEQAKKTIDQVSEEEFDAIIGVNLKGVFLCSKYAIEPMRARGGGSIINVGSISGFVADHRMPVYNASKGGVHMLTRAVAVDNGVDGIRCNAVCPGWILTEMTEALFVDAPDPAAAEQAALAHHPVGRMGTPDDIANMTLWLASDESDFVTGQFFTVDGGLLAGSPIDTAG